MNTPPSTRHPSRPGRRLKWVAGLFFFYTILGFVILPLIVRKLAVSQLSNQLGREVTIESVRINPFALSGSIRGLRITDPDGETLLEWQEVYANFQLSSFFGRPWVFQEVRVIGPTARVRINPDRSLNVSDLIAKFSTPQTNSASPSRPLLLRIERIHITNAVLLVSDLTTLTPFRRSVGPVEVNLTGFESSADNRNPYSFVGTTDSGETFTWKGFFSIDPIRSEGEVTLDGLTISRYSELFQDFVRFDFRGGIISAEADYRLAITPSGYVAVATNASFSLRSLKVGRKGTEENVVELDELSVRGASADAVERIVEAGSVSVAGGRIDLRRSASGSLNLAELAEPNETATNAPASILMLVQSTTNLVARLLDSTNLATATLHALDVTNCAVVWTDEVNRRPAHLVVDRINVAARNLSNRPGTNLTADVSMRWNTNGSVRVGSSVLLSPPTADVSLSAVDVELRALDPYLEPFVNLFVLDSKVGLEGRITLRTTNGLPAVTFLGDARLDDFSTVDKTGSEELVKWKSVRLSGIDAGLSPPAINVREVSVIEPFARLAIETNHAVNLLLAFTMDRTNTVAIEPAAVEPNSSLRQKFGGFIRRTLAANTNAAGTSLMPRVSVEALVLTNASLQFFDRSLEPKVQATVQEVSGRLEGISSDERKRADLHLRGKLDRAGSFEMVGKLNPLNPGARTELKVSFANVDLSPTSPYIGKFLGYRLNRGKLGMELEYETNDGNLKSKNVITLDQFSLGEKVDSPDATKMPVRLAIAILQDRNGRIELNVPIEGRLDDPSFHLGKVILGTLGNMLVKVATSPFSLLGSLFGGRTEEVGFQDFAPGSAEPLASDREKLAALLKGLYERPGLQLEIEGSFDPKLDVEGLRRVKLEAEFRRQQWAALPQTEQSKLGPDQMIRTPEDFTNSLNRAYAEILQAKEAATNQIAAGSTNGVSKAAPSRAIPTEKGGTRLMTINSRFIPDVPPNEVERTVLATIMVSDDELRHLAEERARRIRELILVSEKVEASRLFLTEISSTPSTNRTSRVFFHLR